MIYYTNNTKETEAVGASLAKSIEDAKLTRAFIAMRGEMGVGKTAFTRGFAEHFGISGVKSPTYTIVNEYRGRARIYHFDMYRITDSDDLYSIGYDDYANSPGFCIAEWSENVQEFLPDNAIFVTITRIAGKEDGRKIEIEYENIGI